MKKIIYRLFLGLMITILTLIISVQFFSYNTDYIYENMTKKLNISDSDYMKISKNLTSFLKNNKNDLDFYINLNNERVKTFNKKEIKHMKDVQNIYYNLGILKYIIVFILLASIIFSRIDFLKSIYYSTSISLVFTSILFILIYFSFNKTFILFHKLAFSNDLWLLNPNTDLLINLVPESFFINISKNIIKLFIFINIILSVISKLILNYINKKSF
ncbi:MAG: TIGR01906 family membrane protein [Bacillota bacterium]